MSYPAQIKTLQQVTRCQVMKLLDWNDQQYANFQFESGYSYLKFWIGDDVWGFSELPLTASFWAWWRNHWHKRDMDFINEAKPMSIAERRRSYSNIHNAETISFSPQKNIMEDAYAKMIYKITHEEEVK